MAKKDKTDEKVAKVEVEIIRGRMPVAIAAAIKLGEDSEAKDSELAAKYRTTNGKIADIRADRNFAYITDGFKPTKDMVSQAKAYAEQCESTNSIVKIVKGFGVASEEEAEKFAAARKGARKPTGKEGKKKPKSKKAEKAEAEAAADEELEEDDLDDLIDD